MKKLNRLMIVLTLAVAALAGAAQAKGWPAREMGLLPEPLGTLMGWESGGEMIQLPPQGELAVEKVRPVDCRVALGFSHAPIDGRIDSRGYNGVVNEYDDSQGYAIGHWDNNPKYEYLEAPVVRVKLADRVGFNYLYVRGGFVGSIYRDADAADGPGNGRLLAELGEEQVSQGPRGVPHYKFWRIAFPQLIDTDQVGFIRKFNVLADVTFLRVGEAATKKTYTGSIDYSVGDPVADVTTLGPDFARLPTKDPDVQHPCAFERRFFRPTDRTVHLLKAAGEGREVVLAGEVSSDQSQQVHFLTPPLAAGTAVGAVRVDLNLAHDPKQQGVEDNYVMVTVQDPLIGSQTLLHFDARVGKAERIRVLLDIPDQILADGRRFWITVSSRMGGRLMPDSKISLLTVPVEQARAEFIADRLLLLRGYFSVLSESRPWSTQAEPWGTKWIREHDAERWTLQRLRPQLMDLYTTLEHLHALAPDHPIISGQYYRWLVRDRKTAEQVELPALPQIPGVPRWAVLMDRAAAQIAGIPEWWIRNRMAPNGELGGALGDDTDMVQWWVPSVLLDSEGFAPLARIGFQKIARTALRHNLRDGVNRTTTDALHAYEEGINHMAIMPLVCYGDPRYVEWCMTSVKTMDKWMERTAEGKLKFRINDFGWRQANDPPKEAAPKVSSNADLMLHPHLILAWYNHNPQVIERICAYADAMPDTGAERAYGGGSSVRFAAYWFSRDPKFLLFPAKTEKGDYGDIWQWFKRQPDASVHGKEAWTQPWWADYVRKSETNTLSGHWAWAVKQRRDILEKSLENVLYAGPEMAGVERFRYIWTEAEVYTDRVFLAVQPVAQPMLGGYTVRNKLWPAYAVSYEGLSGDFAALVLEQGRDKLKVAMINLRETPRKGAFRVWQLDHGKYELKIGPDANDDGALDSVESAKTLELARMDAVPVELPPRRLTIYELKQTEKLDDLYARPDLALSEEDIALEGDKVKVTVHNIGSAAVSNVTIALVDGRGKALKSAVIPIIEAPLDLTPRTAVVTLPRNDKAARVVLDPDNRVPEITKANNSIPLAR